VGRKNKKNEGKMKRKEKNERNNNGRIKGTKEAIRGPKGT
jgi:hypothetical protein